MTNRQAAILVLVGLGLFACMNAIALLQVTVVFVGTEGASVWRRAFALMPTFFLGWAGAHAVRHRDELAARIFPDESRLDAPAGLPGWQMLGVVVVSLHVLLLSLPDLVTWSLDAAGEMRGTRQESWAGSGPSALSLQRAVPALLDAVLAMLILVNRDEIVARLFPSAPVPDVEAGAEGDPPATS